MMIEAGAADGSAAGELEPGSTGSEELAAPLEVGAAADGTATRRLGSEGAGSEEFAAPSRVETTASTGARVSWAARQGVHTRRRFP